MGYRPGSSGGGSAATVKSNLWEPPATPHAYDEEFEGPITWDSGADGGWWYEKNGTSGSYATTAIDMYTTYGSGNMRVHIGETQTPSRMRMQPPQGGVDHDLYKKVTFPTNMLVYCRFRYTQAIGNTTNNNPLLNFWISDRSGGGSINTNYLSVEVDNGTVYVRAARHDAGSWADIGTTTDVDSQGQAIEYLALHKVGDTYHYWAGTESNWIYMGNYTNAYTPIDIIVGCLAVNQDHIMSFDFIRFIETDVFPF